MFLSQILRRQEEYTRSLGVVAKKPVEKPRVKTVAKDAVKEKPRPALKLVPTPRIKKILAPDLDLVSEPDLRRAIELADELDLDLVSESEVDLASEPMLSIEEGFVADTFFDIDADSASLKIQLGCIELDASLDVESTEILSSLVELDNVIEVASTPIQNIEPVNLFDLAGFHKTYALTKAERKMATKMIGVPTPISLHEQLTAYLAKTKDDPDAPKSLKELVLMCVNHTMSTLATHGKA